MRYSSYGQMDGIPEKTSDLYNDAGFLNELEVEEKVTEGIDIENATNGQVLSVTVDGTSHSPNWIDPPSGGLDYSTTEQDTGTKWIDGKEIYQITLSLTSSNFTYASNPSTYFHTTSTLTGIDSIINTNGCFVLADSTEKYVFGQKTNVASASTDIWSGINRTTDGHAFICIHPSVGGSLKAITSCYVTLFYTKS